jgi:hypothetical protein
MPAGLVPFLESEASLTRSSVSTAIAAGLSSLILSCDRLSNYRRVYVGRSERVNIVKAYLGTMKPDPVLRKTYILLNKFAGIDQKIRKGEDVNVDELLETVFKRTVYI